MDKNYVNTKEFQDKLIKQLKKVQKQQNQEKTQSIDFFESKTFTNVLLKLDNIDKNKSFQTPELVKQTNIKEDEINSFIRCFRNNVNDHFLFYSETAKFGDETIYFFQEKPFFDELKNAKLNNGIQIRLDYLHEVNLTFLTVLDGSEKITNIKRFLDNNLYHLDQITTKDKNKFEILHGDNEEFQKVAAKLLTTMISVIEKKDKD